MAKILSLEKKGRGCAAHPNEAMISESGCPNPQFHHHDGMGGAPGRGGEPSCLPSISKGIFQVVPMGQPLSWQLQTVPVRILDGAVSRRWACHPVRSIMSFLGTRLEFGE